MCGIGGIVGWLDSAARLEAMAEAMVQRGPDAQGQFVAEGGLGGLVSRRLAIVDPQRGAQPVANEDGTVHVVFNGEIYDHGRLRSQLESRGHRFRSHHSDTEVLVHGWEEWHEELFDRLNGIFAVAVWEPDQGRLVLARDRYGTKPLYYARIDKTLVFASEIKAVLASGLVAPRPSLPALREYFAFQNIWGPRTMFGDVLKVPPATVMTWDRGTVRQREYWDLTFPRSRRGSNSALAEEHREILTRAVRRQLAADVPVTTYLSGGIDSTSITLVARQFKTDVPAYSCVFDLDGVGEDRIVDEREYSRLVASTYHLRHVEHQVDAAYLIHALRPYVRALEDLRMGMGYPAYAIAERVSRDAHVVLSGTGGDELHAGYIGRFQALAPKPGSDFGETFAGIANFLIPQELEAVAFTPEFLAATDGFEAATTCSEMLASCPATIGVTGFCTWTPRPTSAVCSRSRTRSQWRIPSKPACRCSTTSSSTSFSMSRSRRW